MYKVEFFCEDSKLGKAGRALLGIAVKPPTYTPVVNAVAKKGEVVAATEAKSKVEAAINLLMARSGPLITMNEVRTASRDAGLNVDSAAYVAKRMIQLKMAARKGRGTLKKVTNKGG